MNTTFFTRSRPAPLAAAAVFACTVAFAVVWAPPATARAAEAMADVWARTVMHEDGSRTLSKRDYNSQIVEAKTYDRSDALIMKRIFQVDAKGNSKRGFIFDGNDKLIYRIGYVYDEIDRLKETTLYDLSGNVVSRQHHSYDQNGRELKPKLVDHSGTTTAPGQIRPAAAIAGPGSEETVLQTAESHAQAEAKTQGGGPEPGEKKKKGIFGLFRKKQ